MRLGDHLANLNENASTYARRLNLPVPTITRYLRGDRGLSLQSARIILDDAGGQMTLNDLVPNPYKNNERAKATKKITL